MQLPDSYRLNYFFFSIADENYNERELLKLTFKEILLRKCFQDHRTYVKDQANKTDG